MAAPGFNTNRLTLTINGLDVTPEVSRAEVLAEELDADFKSFANGPGGARQYKLAAEFVQGAELFDLVWDNSGTKVPVTVRPGGNATATLDEPHYDGEITITEPDGTLIGGEYDQSESQRWTNEVEWKFTSKPTRRTTGTAPA